MFQIVSNLTEWATFQLSRKPVKVLVYIKGQRACAFWTIKQSFLRLIIYQNPLILKWEERSPVAHIILSLQGIKIPSLTIFYLLIAFTLKVLLKKPQKCSMLLNQTTVGQSPNQLRCTHSPWPHHQVTAEEMQAVCWMWTNSSQFNYKSAF